ncbi:MAG: RimK family alpha-L-glutamate ligase [Sphingomicrobium sp.]|nr:hypothetical protein [Sphingomonadales bacterium]
MPGKPIRAAVLVPAAEYSEPFRWAFDDQAAALEAAGISVEARPWDAPGVAAGVDLIMPLVAWGYHSRMGDWMDLLDRLEDEPVAVLNPVPLLRWNSDKSYLAELAQNGVATVPTLITDALDSAYLRVARERLGSEDLVVKPTVSASAQGTHRLSPGDPLPTDATGRRMLVQPFLPAIATEGELSVMLFNGEYSHAVIKRPKPGDFRVQPEHGGSELGTNAPNAALALAERAVAAAPAEAAYARVDMVTDGAGGWQIMELELIEPALFLAHAPGSAERFSTGTRAAAKKILAQR